MYRYFQSCIFHIKRCIVFFIVLYLFTAYPTPSVAQSEKEFKLKTIVIDAGHGGKDPGAVYRSGKKVTGMEKNITLSVALQVGDYIKTHYKDVKVIYTREKDEFIELHKRASIANKNKADLFISVHVNANKKKDPVGTETYTMGIHKTQGNLDVAIAENSVILNEKDYTREYEGFDVKSPEAYIIFSMLQNSYLEQSLNFAMKLQKQYRETLKREDKGVKQAGFLVLWKTAMPSVLTEIGFISNLEEMKYLMSNSGKKQIAYAIFSAFREYKNELEGVKNDGIVIEKPEYVEEKNIIDEPKQSDSLTVSPDTSASGNPAENIKKTENDQKEKPDQPVIPGIQFKIQITSSPVKIPLNSRQFKGLHVEETESEGAYKYTVCASNSFREIENLQKLIKNDFPDSFIIAFKNGKKISVSDAKKEIKN